jgi:VanZ family protein
MVNFVHALFGPRVMRPLFCLLTLFTLTMAFLPKPPATPIDQFGDKFEHMLAFAVLTAVALVAWPQSRRWRIILLLSGLGAMIEFVQEIPDLHRDSDWHDWAADTIAIVAAAVVVSPIVHVLRLDRTPAPDAEQPEPAE